jgi:hypothetical protein
MKTITNISKTLLRASLILSLVFAVSCSSDDDNSDVEEIVEGSASLPAATLTTYTGDLSYSGTEGVIVVEETATATISGQAANYTISFSDGAPSINNVQFSFVNGRYITVGSSTIVITIDDEELEVQAQQNGNNWSFDGDR